MRLQLSLPKDDASWELYTPDEFVSEIAHEHVDETTESETEIKVVFSGVDHFTNSEEVLGISLPSGGYTLPEAEFRSLRAPDGVTCDLSFDGIGSFSQAAEKHVQTRLQTGGVRFNNVIQLERWKNEQSGMAISFADQSGYTLPYGKVHKAELD